MLFLATLSGLSTGTTADTITGKVVGIADGDTLTLLVERIQYKIRVMGIDSPERKQAWGDQAKTSLGRLAFNRIAIADCPKVDRWGRKICKVTVDAVDVGQMQIKSGMAWWYRQYANEQQQADRVAYEKSESQARLEGVGLWSESNPVPPWSFRHSK